MRVRVRRIVDKAAAATIAADWKAVIIAVGRFRDLDTPA